MNNSDQQSASAPFGITKEELSSLHASRDIEKLESYGGLAALARFLKTDLVKGLHGPAQDNYAERKRFFGENVYPEPVVRSIFYYIFESLKDTTLIILMVAAAVSLLFAIIAHEGKNGWLDSIGIFIAIFLVSTVTSFNNWTKERQFRELNKIKEQRKVKVIRDGKHFEILINEVMVGDLVVLETGDQVPADGLFVDGFNLSLDASHLSGESKEIRCNAHNPFIPNAARIQEGVCSMLVVAVGTQTEWGKTLLALMNEEPETTPLQKQLEALATLIGYVGMAFATLNFIALTIKFSVIVARDPRKTFLSWETATTMMQFLLIAVTIVVVAVPEGLPLAVTISLAYSMKKMLADMNLVRHLSACETMGSVTDICSDKTGTLTTNRMEVTDAVIADQEYLDGNLPKASELQGDVLNILCDAIAINSTANVEYDFTTKIPQFLGNKTECALLYMLIKNFDIDYSAIREDADADKAQVYTFSSERKRMSTVLRFENENEFRIFTKGAAEIVYALCNRQIKPDGTIVEITNEMRAKTEETIKKMASNGLRTLCIAFNDFRVADESELADTQNPPERELICIAIVGIKDPLRKEVIDAVDKCKKAGITIRMVTGDNLLTAEFIARECGILTTDGLALEGKDFRDLDEYSKRQTAVKLQVMARSTPLDKLELVKTLRAVGRIVAVTGDGTNDGPALKAAHVGLSMGLSGTEIAKEASDIVILDDNFKSIAKSVLWGRSVYENIRKFLQFQITINFAALIITFLGSVTSQGYPLTPVQLLWINLIMDTLAALALATEPPSEDLMNRKPHGTEDNLITNNMWKNIFVQGLYQIFILLLLIYGHDKIFGPPGPNNPLSKRQNEKDFTLVFNVFVFCQLFNQFNARKINNEMNILENISHSWVFLSISCISTITQVIMVEFGGYIGFGTYGLSWIEWILSITLGFLSIPIGYILRVIPVPKQGFCGFNISLSFISPRKWFKYAKRRLFGNISHDFEDEHELLEDEE
jgi:Ca2+-transporting ATPase